MKIVIVVSPSARYPRRLKRMLTNNRHTVVDVSHISSGIKEQPAGMIIVATGHFMHVPFLNDLAGARFPVLWIYYPEEDSCPDSPYISSFISRTSPFFMSDVMTFISSITPLKEEVLL